MWEPAKTAGCKLLISSDAGSPAPILSLDPHNSKEIMGVRDCAAGGNKSHLEHIRDKVNTWVDTLRNGRSPAIFCLMGWIAYKLNRWSGVKYGIGKTTNDLKEAKEVLNKTDYRILNIPGIARTVKKG